MRKRIAILLAALGVVIAGVLGSRSAHREPGYQGKPLSYWFKEYYRYSPEVRFLQSYSPGLFTDFPSSINLPPDPGLMNVPNAVFPNAHRGQEAAGAIQAIGTNAVSFLLREGFNTNQDSPWKTKMIGTLNKVGFPPFIPRNEIRERAFGAVFKIKPPASVLLPQLIPALRSKDRENRYAALLLLGSVGEVAEDTMPHLVAGLQSTNASDARAAAVAARYLWPASKAAIPDLIEVLKRPVSDTAWTHLAAMSALGSFGTNAASAIPVLLKLLSEQEEVSRRAATTLEDVGYEDSAIVAELAKRLNAAAGDKSRFSVANTLLSIEPTNADAMAVFSEFVKADTDLGERAIKALGKLGPAGGSAIPVLRELAQKGIPWQRLEALDALKRIEAASTNQAGSAK
jgi:hypothetical protein